MQMQQQPAPRAYNGANVFAGSDPGHIDRVSGHAEMAAYDALPPLWRQMIANAPIKFSAIEITELRAEGSGISDVLAELRAACAKDRAAEIKDYSRAAPAQAKRAA